jgi:hypothetical protein
MDSKAQQRYAVSVSNAKFSGGKFKALDMLAALKRMAGLTLLLPDGFPDPVYICTSVEYPLQVSFFIINSEEWGMAQLKKRTEKIIDIPPNVYLRILIQPVTADILLHFEQGLVSGEQQLRFPEVFHIPGEDFRLVLAM